ncbi:unnamed protein product [marine sediment metagenome]|uniref:Uncharacterized protein n=1 Tax=marine sediment metagenome TaxID=412755 RepID=X1EI71_9ZZZZ
MKFFTSATWLGAFPDSALAVSLRIPEEDMVLDSVPTYSANGVRIGL